MPEMGDPTPEQMQKMLEEMRKKENEGLTPEEIEKRDKEREERKQRYIALLNETLDICREGSYKKDGITVDLNRTSSQISGARVFLPDEVEKMIAEEDAYEAVGADTSSPCVFSCENKDALSLAHEKYRDSAYGTGSGGGRILLLNMASAVRPGGGVRDGFGGQEEDLCRDSTLLMSLESDEAKPYYEYNNSLNTHMGSDAIVISPDVVVFRNESGELLDKPFTISVITCSAPNLRFGREGLSEEEYEKMLYERIEGILRCAVSLGYKNIILGAFGCGAFKNDAALVSDDFYKALTGPAGQGLNHADFAVLCTPGKEYNYNEFCRNFSREDKKSGT